MTQDDNGLPKSSDKQDKKEEYQKEDIGTQMNVREQETEPFSSESNDGQESTTGMDYATRQARSVGQGGPGRNPDENNEPQEVESNVEDANISRGSIDQDYENEETSVNEFSQAPESDNTQKVKNTIYGEGAIRKDDELIDPEKRLEDHPGAYQIKEKSEDQEKNSNEK